MFLVFEVGLSIPVDCVSRDGRAGRGRVGGWGGRGA